MTSDKISSKPPLSAASPSSVTIPAGCVMEEKELQPKYSTSTTLCSICAHDLDPSRPSDINKETYASEKLTLPIQRECCSRWVCRNCLDENPRFATYCPFCPSSINALPPSYDTIIGASACSSTSTYPQDGKSPVHRGPVEDILHFVRPTDSILSLSFLYSIPVEVLRLYNRLYSDSLLFARQTILIPGRYYQGPSHSAKPPEGEEEETRKSKLKRFQTRSKCVDVKMAEVYLNNAGWDEGKALEEWWKDEKWEMEQRKKEGKRKSRGMFGTRLS